MINADRLLRIAYREIPLPYLFDQLKTYEGMDKHFGMNRDNSSAEEFNCDNENIFFQLICSKYTSVYPENYSIEEVKKTLVYYLSVSNLNFLSNKVDISLLFFYVTEQLFKVKHQNIQVDYDKLLEWDGFCNKVDANIFLGAFCAQHQEIPLEKVDIVIRHDNTTLNDILREGAADNHMHMKASGYIIEMCMANLFLCQFDDNRDLSNFIKDSGMVYTGFAKDEEEAFLNIQKIKFLRLYLEHLLKTRRIGKKGSQISQQSVRSVLSANDLVELESFLTRLIPQNYEVNKELIDVDDLLFDLEDKYAIKDTERKYVYVERQFLKEMFLAEKNEELNDFNLFLFNIYLAGISQLRFFFVQDNVGMGFKKFKYREDSKGDLLDIKTKSYKIKLGNPDVYKSVFDRYYSSKIVHYVEFRIAFQEAEKLKKTLSEIEQSAQEVYERYQTEKSLQKIKYGVIIHYIKEENPPLVTPTEYRWEKLREKKMKEAIELQNYIDKKYHYHERIVGVDAANYEMECRPEVFAPMFRMHKYSVVNGKSLGITYHVGEAFECLCSGLRAIDEAIVFMNLGRGDRLGHAIALGIDVDQYKKSKRSTQSLTLQNYVDNLAWMFEIISFYQRDKQDNTLLFLRDEFVKKSTRLLKDVPLRSNGNVELRNYIDSWYLRGDDPEVYVQENLLRFEQGRYGKRDGDKPYRLNVRHPYHKRAFLNPFAVELYQIYLKNIQFYKNGSKVIQINPTDEYWQAVKIAQQCLHRKIYDRDIAIETNPSSNRKISPVSKFIDLPFLAFNQHHLTSYLKKCGAELSISVNTDDCDIFQSDLANEYALVAAALKKENVSNQEIYEYIDMLRKMSIHQTFVKKDE